MKSQSIKSKVKQRNTPKSKIGMGDYNGTAIKQKMARPISVMIETPAKMKKGKTPKALA